MPNPRQLIQGMPRSKNAKYAIISLLAILVVIGLLPAVVISVGTVAIPTATLAALWLLARRYGVIGE